MTLDAHCVFNGSTEPPDYLTNLTLAKVTETTLRSARDEIRDAIRERLGQWEATIAKREMFDSSLTNIEPPSLKPKFRMQGSFAYRTCNLPAQLPQEIDLDDGLFLPITFFSENGARHPVVMSQGLFLAVEQVLEPLCKNKGWTLNKSKASCVRVEIDEGAHIDVALYAVPDAAYTELLEKAANARGQHVAEKVYQELLEARDLSDDIYKGLPNDQIMLAHREEGWKPSDPRKLEDWFHAALETHGEQLRRVCRYLKGWRDHQWASCRLASIALMSAVVSAYAEAEEQLPENRDDLAMLMVAERLPDILSNVITNPVVAGQRLDEGWTPEQRAEFVAEAKNFLRRLEDALYGTDDPAVAIANLIAEFGGRIPDDARLVLQETMRAPSEKSALAAPAIIGLTSDEQMARAEAAASEIEQQGSTSKPWFGGAN